MKLTKNVLSLLDRQLGRWQAGSPETGEYMPNIKFGMCYVFIYFGVILYN